MSARILIACHTGSLLVLYLARCFQSSPAPALIVKSLINPNPTAGQGSRPCGQRLVKPPSPRVELHTPLTSALSLFLAQDIQPHELRLQTVIFFQP